MGAGVLVRAGIELGVVAGGWGGGVPPGTEVACGAGGGVLAGPQPASTTMTAVMRGWMAQ